MSQIIDFRHAWPKGIGKSIFDLPYKWREPNFF